MGWISLAVLEDLQQPFHLGSDQSHTVKSKSTPKEFYLVECQTEDYPSLQSGTISEHSEDQCSQKLTSSTEVFHVKTFQLRDVEKVWRESEVDYISKCQDLSTKLIPFYLSRKRSSYQKSWIIYSHQRPCR